VKRRESDDPPSEPRATTGPGDEGPPPAKIAVASAADVARFAAAADDGGDAAPPEANAEDSLDQVRARRDEFQDKYLRAQAECVNISRRLSQDHAESLKLAGMALARALLPCLDNFHRTLDNLDARKKDDPIVDGVGLIAAEFEKVLKDHGVAPIEAIGKPFDPALHQAMMQDHESDAPPGTVTRELEPGYMMHGRVLRHSKVVVSAADGDDEAEDGDSGEETSAA
jgi:molecular chaperone GrpE